MASAKKSVLITGALWNFFRGAPWNFFNPEWSGRDIRPMVKFFYLSIFDLLPECNVSSSSSSSAPGFLSFLFFALSRALRMLVRTFVWLSGMRLFTAWNLFGESMYVNMVGKIVFYSKLINILIFIFNFLLLLKGKHLLIWYGLLCNILGSLYLTCIHFASNAFTTHRKALNTERKGFKENKDHMWDMLYSCLKFDTLSNVATNVPKFANQSCEDLLGTETEVMFIVFLHHNQSVHLQSATTWNCSTIAFNTVRT